MRQVTEGGGWAAGKVPVRASKETRLSKTFLVYFFKFQLSESRFGIIGVY
jgi:hypothetical protein